MALPAQNMLYKIGDRLQSELKTLPGVDKVNIGSPFETLGELPDDELGLNLFFYQIMPSGLYPDTPQNEPVYIRLFCLITAMSNHNGLKHGEASLQLLGDVIRFFHNTPIRKVSLDTAGNTNMVAHLQAILLPLTTDELNQIWSNQNDVSYQLSIGYEFSLAPIYPLQTAKVPPTVVDASSNVELNLNPEELSVPSDSVGRDLEFKTSRTGPETPPTNSEAYLLRRNRIADTAAHQKIELVFTSPDNFHEAELKLYEQHPGSLVEIQSKPIATNGDLDVEIPNMEGTYVLIVEFALLNDKDTTILSNALTVQILPEGET